ncbi:hypothetical protein [Clostridium sp.]|uniref:hypothetical protein n=1 Tax=Clostridium sp. TaxID=1506 RepID=UPI001B41C554|nr:hypothetical protein [Clostridium sp.]MBP3917442.1 hypothetical protein [Clostridium sp.]
MRVKNLFPIMAIVSLIGFFNIKEAYAVTEVNGYIVETHGALDWYGDKNTETINNRVYLPPKFAKFNGTLSQYGGSWLYREVRAQHGYKITSYQPIKPASLSWPTTSGSNMNLRENMPENNMYGGLPTDYTCVNTAGMEISNVWSNFKTCGTRPNYYGYLTSATKFTGAQYYGSTSGEFRYIGYSSDGLALTNPFMPSDRPGINTPGEYPFKVILGTATPSGTTISSTFDKYSTKYDDSSNTELYKIKTKAIKELLQITSNGMAAVSTDVTYWANRLSLRNDARYDTPIFWGVRNNETTYVEVVGAAPVGLTNDLIMQKISIYDDNDTPDNYNDDTLLMTVQRNINTGEITKNLLVSSLKANNTYRVETTVYNNSTETTKLNPALIDLQFSFDESATNTPLDNGVWRTNKLPGGIAGNSYGKFNYTLLIPAGVQNKVAIHDKINKSHFSYGDNAETNNDLLSLIVNVTKYEDGDLIAKETILKDANGKTVDYVIPGRDYKFVYKFIYKGPERYYYAANGTDATGSPIYKKVAKSYLIRGNGKYYTSVGTNDKIEVSFSKFAIEDCSSCPLLEMKDGVEYSFESDLFMAASPYVETTFKITTTSDINKDTSNDNFSYCYKGEYDLRVTNLKAYPATFEPRNLDKVYATVQYNIVYNIPDNQNIKDSYPAEMVETVIVIDGKYYHYADLVIPGNNTFIKCVEIDLPDEKKPDRIGSYAYAASVIVNPGYNVYEYLSDININYLNNNKASTTEENSVSLGSSTFLRPSVMVGRTITEKVRNVEYHTNERTYKYPGYDKTNYRFYSYSTVTNTTRTFSERYKIVSVEFKSKETEEQGLGRDGWVELNSSTKGIVKAGYGFRLRITTELYSDYTPYRDMLPQSYINTDNVKNNSPEDIIVRFNNKYYTASGINSEPAFNSKVYIDSKLSDNSQVANKAIYVFETDVNNKIFTDKNMKDRDYTLDVYTPVINTTSLGVDGGKLGDNKSYKITISGSYLDDVNPHLDN